MAASVVSSEDGDSTGAGGAGVGAEPSAPAAFGAVLEASALPVMMYMQTAMCAGSIHKLQSRAAAEETETLKCRRQACKAVTVQTPEFGM